MSSPTLDAVLIRLRSTVTIGFLALWILAAALFSAIDFREPEWHFVDPFLSVSLLTYLICRMLVACSTSNSRNDSMAHRLTNAHHHSRRGAFAILIFASAWIYELFFKILWMIFLNILSGAIYSAHAFPEAMAEVQKNAEAQAHWYHNANQNGTAAINGNMTEIDRNLTAQFELFKEEMGFDPIQLFGWMEPNVLLAFVSLAWFTFATLSLYVARLWWNSLKKAFSPTPAAPTPEKLHDV